MAWYLSNKLGSLQAINPRHLDVQHNQAKPVVSSQFHGLDTIGAADGLMSGPSKQNLQEPTVVHDVLGNQYGVATINQAGISIQLRCGRIGEREAVRVSPSGQAQSVLELSLNLFEQLLRSQRGLMEHSSDSTIQTLDLLISHASGCDHNDR